MACLHESQALAFVAGELDAAGRGVVEAHVDDCAACRQLLAQLVKSGSPTPRDAAIGETMLASSPPPSSASERSTTGEWAPGTRIGRYVVLARVGRGGMGTVFRAEDVELGRPVALKRLHADADDESRARLLREARAAAQLQHPNVVTVHEVGEHAGTPYLAMELVDGVTLTQWLREQPRSWREITGIVAQAGRGLAAAHARGLVHRDFKPDNVLVDRTGRARVADFGLARAHDAPSEPSGQPGTRIGTDERLARMTATGSLAGTPAYMSPELVDGGSPDARSDQYALAVTLYEALRGQHPFAGETAAALWVEMASGRVRSGGRPVPAWIDRHVRRGLAVDPAARWPDVTSFVEAIETPPRRRWTWLAAGATALAAAGSIAFVMTRAPTASGPSCDELANEYQQRVTAADLEPAMKDPEQVKLALDALDRFADAYRKGVRESCRATRAGTQSSVIGDKRSACLEMAKRRAWRVTSGLSSGIDARPGLVSVLDELPDVAACSDPEWLDRAAPLPVAAADREALYLAEAKLIEAGKVRDDGQLDQAATLTTGVIETTKRLGDRSLAARANLFASEIARDRGDMQQAALDAMEAWSAASAHGDTDLTLRAQLAMLGASASRDQRAIEGFAGLGTDVPETANGARLIAAHGDALMAAGKFAEGEAAYRRAQAIREQVLPAEHVDRALGMQRIGAALVIQKRAAEALPILEAAHAVVERAFPPLRREAIDGVRYLAMAQEELGQHERALALRRIVLQRRTALLGGRSGLVLDARADIARALGDLGDHAEAARELQIVVEGFDGLLGGKSVNGANARVSLANALVTLGRFDEADAALAKAVPMLITAHGADSPYALVAEYAQVRSAVERARPVRLAEATAQLDRIEPVFAKLFGAQSAPVAAALASRARIALARNDAAGADALIARAMPMLGDDKRSDRGELAMLRARVLWKLGNRDAARASAEASARDYDAAGAGYASDAVAARAWLAKPSATVTPREPPAMAAKARP